MFFLLNEVRKWPLRALWQRVCNEFDLNFPSHLDLYFEFNLEAMYYPYILMLFPK